MSWATAESRLWGRTTPGPNGCVMWCGYTDRSGYGQIKVGGKIQYAHRVAYRIAVGPIPAGLQIDHLCRTPRCVNPHHLEAVTQQENLRRGLGFIGVNHRKTSCDHGHPFSPDNTYTSPSSGHRSCRTCMRENWRRVRARKRGVAV